MGRNHLRSLFWIGTVSDIYYRYVQVIELFYGMIHVSGSSAFDHHALVAKSGGTLHFSRSTCAHLLLNSMPSAPETASVIPACRPTADPGIYAVLRDDMSG